MTDYTIASLIALAKLAHENEAREAARELHRRGVSIVGLIPTTHKRDDYRRMAVSMSRVDTIPEA